MLVLAKRLRARRADGERGDGERGDTLVEVLITVVIVGIAFTGILAGLATAINLSGIDRGDANVRTVLVSSTESVKNQAYVACPSATNSSYNPTSGVTLPSGWSASNVVVKQLYGWNGSSFVTCSSLGTDGKLQKILVEATSPDGRSKDTIEIVKRSSS